MHEILWLKLRPTRLPRGFSCLIVAVVYNPPGADERLLTTHLMQSLTTVEAAYPNCGIIIAGDFNRAKTSYLQRHFRLKQLVKSPTRGDAILDLILTNLHSFYSSPTIAPPFGLSDHNTILLTPKERVRTSTRKTVTIRDIKVSNKTSLGRYLYDIDWALIDQLDNCEDKLDFFSNLVKIGMDLLTPKRQIRINSTDAPWMNERLKSLILKRQKVFLSEGRHSLLYKYYRNTVNQERKKCRAAYYKSNIQELKNEKPNIWWKEVKRLSGMQSQNNGILEQLAVDELENLNINQKANVINKALLEPLQDYTLTGPLTKLPLEDNPTFLEVSEERVLKHLLHLNSNKACGPDEIPNWFLKEYSDIIASPICKILNASFKEQRLPNAWKIADVTPIAKKKPVSNISKDLRPISLTSCISKLAEDFVVNDYIKPAVTKVIDQNQFGGIPNSSTTLALISMIHNWLQGTDGTGSTVRAILFDYRKAFDLIDHKILIDKVGQLDLPNSIVNWIIDFLSNRSQRIKLASNCFSEWGYVPSGVPQGTKLGPYLFIIMINDLSLSEFPLWKFVDDTTASEIVLKGEPSAAQSIADNIANWSLVNRVQLNCDKCKELRICFARNQVNFAPIVVNDKPLEVVECTKLLGLSINSNLTWNTHVEEVVGKVSKRLYFLIQLRRAKVPPNDLVLFYITCIRSVIDYAIPVIYHSLPNYLVHELERLQKRAMAIIYPNSDYIDALSLSKISTLQDHHESLCIKLFKVILDDKDHVLYGLIPSCHKSKYNLRKSHKFNLPRVSTDRFNKSFINYMSRFFN